jgi:hypothetical protein
MNDKERLQEIKRKVMTFDQELREIDLEKHIDWLIFQAQKAEKLETDKEFFKREYMQTNEKYLKVLEQLQQAQAKAERYEKALREIANEQEVGEGDFDADDVANNLIATAKEALEGSS